MISILPKSIFGETEAPCNFHPKTAPNFIITMNTRREALHRRVLLSPDGGRDSPGRLTDVLGAYGSLVTGGDHPRRRLTHTAF